MKIMSNLSQLTQQYQVAKTLRFELKPIAETLDWIKKHNIIEHKNHILQGKDAERATNYQYLKKLLDEMHRIFLQQALVVEKNSAEKQELERIISNIHQQTLEGEYPSIINDKTIKIRDGLKILFERLYNKTLTYWVYQYKEEMPIFWQQDIDELNKKIADTDDKKLIKNYQRIISTLIKKQQKVEFKGKDYKALTSGGLALQLLEWLIRKEKIQLTYQELQLPNSALTTLCTWQDLLKIVRCFDGFTTYLTGFNENRANVYHVGDKQGFISTSVLYRCFEQNLQFHLANGQKWQTIWKNIQANKAQLLEKGFDIDSKLAQLEQVFDVSLDAFFAPETFAEFISQEGINKYNQVLGGLASKIGEHKTQGLNEIINLARQQISAKRSQFPPFQLLYKQILSKGEKPFIETFENDQEVIAALNEFISEHIDNPEGFISKFASELNDTLLAAIDDKAHIYIAKDKLNVISHALSGNWHSIKGWFEKVYTDKEVGKILNTKYINVEQLDSAMACIVEDENFYQAHIRTSKNELAQHIDEQNVFLSWFEYQLKSTLTKILIAAERYKQLNLSNIDKNRSKIGEKGFEQIAIIKNLLDECNELNRFLTHFKWQKSMPQQHADYWYSFIQSQLDAFPIFELYNKVRNYVTKKPFSTDKLKINFDNSTLLDGWDRNKESANYGVLFEKQGNYYLGIMTPNSNMIFDYDELPSDSENKIKQKNELKKQVLATSGESAYRKINYKLLPGPNKMLPKVFFAKSNIDFYQPSDEIIKIKNEKLYSKEAIKQFGIENLHKYIEFCQQSLLKHPEWAKAYGFTEESFKPSTSYNSVDEFYREIEQKGYSLTFDEIKESYINQKIANGELYLFQIYNKDFSANKKRPGTDNLHTSYWKFLFSKDNLVNTVLKLNGQAEIFYRPASIEYEPEKRIKGHHAETLKDKFNYPILKDKRYSEDKFLFHCPITFNFKAQSQPIGFNQTVRQFLKNNQQVNIIGIDRGEKHLLYYSIINPQGEILEQGSFNTITNNYKTDEGFKSKSIDYRQKLDEKEKLRDTARKSWSAIENIKDLKAGYLSHIVHKLAQLIIKYNAIVVLEDLNQGFKRGRFKIEKQVYQKFEKALIDKLNYLTFKDRESRTQAGHYLNAYQLTNKFESFQKMGKQSGILFYTTAEYTSTTDPVTGFIKNIYKSYKNVADSITFWQQFDAIVYNHVKDRFEFTYNVSKFSTANETLNKQIWTVCSNVQRSFYVAETNTHELFLVTDKIKELLANAGHNYSSQPNIKEFLIQCQSKQVHKDMLRQFNFILTMRVTDSNYESGTSENDFILSPVEPFFDSRKARTLLPENGDANGAYNIARKGILMLQAINTSETVDKVDLMVKKEQWQNYCQAEQVVKIQLKKLTQ
jgi:CRISPR-associated protein Cpf1